jgi:YD repeat-containing protein
MRRHPEETRTSLFSGGEGEPVEPAIHYQSLSTPLLQSLSGTPPRPALAILGCGSVGSKLALHAARDGQDIAVLSDKALLRPHNLARHALGPRYLARNKADALAEELAGFEMTPEVHCGDLGIDLRATEHRARLFPKRVGAAINSTASLAVREALVSIAGRRLKARLLEVALFGRGLGAFLLVDGPNHKPTHCDLVASMYMAVEGTRAGRLLLDPSEGLSEIQIGQGCGSLTMKVNDAQLSAMTAGLSQEIGRVLDAPITQGLIVVAAADADSSSVTWTRHTVPTFEEITIIESDGWKLRLSRDAADQMRSETAAWPGVETGGVMIGLASARLKTVTVVDLLEAPNDSRRSPSLFVLGTKGLQSAIRDRHERSGRTLFDVGTWHSHLSESGPSAIDWLTAAELAAERAPPSILLIKTPNHFYALAARGNSAEPLAEVQK